MAMEWLKTQFAGAKSGDKSARRRLLIFGAALLICVFLFVSGQAKSEPVRVTPKNSSTTMNLTSGFVHVSGAVEKPGVYPIDSDMRLFEVISLAGGFTEHADQDSVNLARTVTDGEQILVSQKGSVANAKGLVSLNRASVSELDQLPGIGPTLAARILDWREANQGFKNVDDLRKVGGIGDKLFAAVRKLVTL